MSRAKKKHLHDVGAFLEFLGGADGARTRDPRRDRSVIEVNVYAGFQLNHIPKNLKNVSISCGFSDFYSKNPDPELWV